MKKEILVTFLAFGCAAQIALAQDAYQGPAANDNLGQGSSITKTKGRPSQRLAEGESCLTETPTPTSSETPTPTPTCTTTPTTTPTSTPTPTTTPTPPCEFYKGTIKADNAWGAKDSKSVGYDVKMDQGAASLKCLTDKLSDIKRTCDTKGVFGAAYYDDCIAVGVSNNFAMDADCHGEDMKWHKIRGVKHYGMWDELHGTSGFSNNYMCTDGEFFFDANCQQVPKADYENLCGELSVRFILSSPISLLWEHDYNLNGNQTLANFKLDPSSNNTWTVWKASEKAPLLVYDPEHKGVVTDASQLFGNWTFGGKRTASLVNDASSVAAGKWENGYEALATLDRDNNGKVDGSELNDLALWFDANQNGVSEAGEVKNIVDTGVTALYYKGYVKDALSNDLRLEVGYERSVAGHTVQGTSVDWYADTAQSKAELANFNGKFAEVSADSAPVLAGDINTQASFGGLWKWYLTDESLADGVNDGVFILSESEGAVKGYNFAERHVVSSPNDSFSAVGRFNRVVGSHSVKDGKKTFSFNLSNKNVRLENEAVLSEDGREMNGTTKAIAARGAEVLSYTWKAVKVD